MLYIFLFQGVTLCAREIAINHWKKGFPHHKNVNAIFVWLFVIALDGGP